MAAKAVTVQDALRTGAERLALREDLRDFAKEDAQQLLEIATGRTRVQMLAHPNACLSEEEQGRLKGLLQQRLQAVPIQYLRGSQEFYGREFLVTPDVLIPRPETEDIITAVLERIPDRHSKVRIADVGTGSGAIAITLALELPDSIVTAIDISAAALKVAKKNAVFASELNNPSLTSRVRFCRSDIFQTLEPEEQFDVIVSNPPYIPFAEGSSLHAQVRDHEPHLALFGGEDGHDIYRRLISNAQDRLCPDGFLVMETAGRTDLLKQMLCSWSDVVFRADLRGTQRVVVAVRP